MANQAVVFYEHLASAYQRRGMFIMLSGWVGSDVACLFLCNSQPLDVYVVLDLLAAGSLK